MSLSHKYSSLLLLLLLLPATAFSQAIRDLPGFRTHRLSRNDDGSTGPIGIGFNVNFFGRNYSSLYVNNNGNVTFHGPLPTYIPFGLAHTNAPIIAAFFADVDTRGSRSHEVTYGTDVIEGHAAFGTDFFDVGYYNENDDRLNTFQLILIDRADTGPGNFDIEFNYAGIRWDLGDAGRSGNVGPVVGFSNGTGEANALFELTGSMTLGAFLDGGEYSLVAHELNSNVPGRYIFHARNGTIQTPANPAQMEFAPILLEPQQATINIPVTLVAGLRLQGAGEQPRNISIQATFLEQTVVLRDAGDGRYTGQVSFSRTGDVHVSLHATANGSDSTGEGTVKVWGRYAYSGGPILVDLGRIKAGTQSCKPLPLTGEQQGEIQFEFNLLQSLPREHILSLRAGQAVYTPGSSPLILAPGAGKELCLVASRWAPSSEATGQPWLQLVMGTAQGKQALASVQLRWKVDELTFWERWGWLILGILIVLLVAFIIYGYIRPRRFPRDLALTFVPDYADLDASPQPLSQWRGVGIGFYRDARAFLHPDFRVSGNSRGALGVLRATREGLWVAPTGGSLSRELDLEEWEEVVQPGRPARLALVYRFGERGPYFRIATGPKRINAQKP